MLAGTRGIEPPFSPLAALTSNEWLALWYTRSRRAFPCSARLSGLPNGDNCLLIDCYNRNDAMQLVGLRSGLPKTHPSVQCRAAILHHARLGIEPARLGNRTPLHTATAPSLHPVSTEHWCGVPELNRQAGKAALPQALRRIMSILLCPRNLRGGMSSVFHCVAGSTVFCVEPVPPCHAVFTEPHVL